MYKHTKKRGVRTQLAPGKRTTSPVPEALSGKNTLPSITNAPGLTHENDVLLSQTLMQRFIENSTDCIKVLDLQGRLLYMNPGGQLVMELDDFSSCAFAPWTELWQGKEQETVRNAVAIAQAGGVATFRASCSTAKGTEKWWDVTVTPIFNTDGAILYLLAASRDVTEIVQSRQVLDHFFSVSLDLLCLINFAGEFCKVNSAFERVLGYVEQELLGRSIFSLIHANDIADTRWELTKLQQGIPTLRFENRYRTKNGSYKWLDWTALPVMEKEMLYAVARDITELKMQEEQKNAFISMASHELRQPITTIKASLQLVERRLRKLTDNIAAISMEDASSFDAVREMISRSILQVGIQNCLINDLLDTSRIQADKLQLSLEMCNLVDVVRAVVEGQRIITPERMLHLELPTEAFVRIDADRIGQVVNNYVTNALKYSNEAEPITVGMCVEERQVCVWVQDAGPGLSQDQQEHIWERFYQAPAIHEQQVMGVVGLGLGLYICQELIRRHGGNVGVESAVGKGSRFWFALPLP